MMALAMLAHLPRDAQQRPLQVGDTRYRWCHWGADAQSGGQPVGHIVKPAVVQELRPAEALVLIEGLSRPLWVRTSNLHNTEQQAIDAHGGDNRSAAETGGAS